MNPSASRKNDLQEMLPLSPAAFFVLFALADGEKHGYLIMQEVKVLSDGKLQMDRRRNYRLTRAGKQLLNAEFSRQNEVLLLAKAKKVFPLGGKA
jgi:hypothetical protein